MIFIPVVLGLELYLTGTEVKFEIKSGTPRKRPSRQKNLKLSPWFDM